LAGSGGRVSLSKEEQQRGFSSPLVRLLALKMNAIAHTHARAHRLLQASSIGDGSIVDAASAQFQDVSVLA